MNETSVDLIGAEAEAAAIDAAVKAGVAETRAKAVQEIADVYAAAAAQIAAAALCSSDAAAAAAKSAAVLHHYVQQHNRKGRRDADAGSRPGQRRGSSSVSA